MQTVSLGVGGDSGNLTGITQEGTTKTFTVTHARPFSPRAFENIGDATVELATLYHRASTTGSFSDGLNGRAQGVDLVKNGMDELSREFPSTRLLLLRAGVVRSSAVWLS
jgi:hypothetical protein